MRYIFLVLFICMAVGMNGVSTSLFIFSSLFSFLFFMHLFFILSSLLILLLCSLILIFKDMYMAKLYLITLRMYECVHVDLRDIVCVHAFRDRLICILCIYIICGQKVCHTIFKSFCFELKNTIN